MENATCGKRNFNDVTSLLRGRLPEYPIFQRFLEIAFEISACANSVYQAFLLPRLKRLGTRLSQVVCINYYSTTIQLLPLSYCSQIASACDHAHASTKCEGCAPLV